MVPSSPCRQPRVEPFHPHENSSLRGKQGAEGPFRQGRDQTANLPFCPLLDHARERLRPQHRSPPNNLVSARNEVGLRGRPRPGGTSGLRSERERCRTLRHRSQTGARGAGRDRPSAGRGDPGCACADRLRPRPPLRGVGKGCDPRPALGPRPATRIVLPQLWLIKSFPPGTSFRPGSDAARERITPRSHIGGPPLCHLTLSMSAIACPSTAAWVAVCSRKVWEQLQPGCGRQMPVRDAIEKTQMRE